jgi:succinoglycan biosynthesis transport protein ExoP
MNTSLGPERFEPGGYREVSRRHWPIVLGLAVLGLAAAAVYVAVVPQAYTATAVVDLPAPAGPSEGIVVIPGLVPDLHGQAQIVRSSSVAAPAGRMMHSGLSAQALSKKVTVTVPPNSWLLDIACADPSASRAATCANDFAKAYLQHRATSLANLADAQVNSLSREVNSLDRAKAALNTKIAALPPNSPRWVADEARLKSDHGRLRWLTQQIETRIGQRTNSPPGGSILTLATPPGKPSSPDKLFALPVGLVAGLLLGLTAVFLLSRRDKRIDGTGEA